MTNFSHGRTAEQAAADYLKHQGFKVVDLNWRTRQCEIDIVATKDGCVYFVEVKYRKNTAQGSGLEYVTPAKLRQMSFAAEVWTAKHSWDGDVSLAAIEVSGNDYAVAEFIESID